MTFSNDDRWFAVEVSGGDKPDVVANLETGEVTQMDSAFKKVNYISFNGAGDTMTPTWVNFFCFWVFQIPVAWYLAYPLEMGPLGVFIAVAAGYSVSAVVGAVLFRRGGWKTKVV